MPVAGSIERNVQVTRPVCWSRPALTSTCSGVPSTLVVSTVVGYDCKPAGTVIVIAPKPMLPSWNVVQSRFGSSCSVTVTSWAAAVAFVGSFSNSMRVGQVCGCG